MNYRKSRTTLTMADRNLINSMIMNGLTYRKISEIGNYSLRAIWETTKNTYNLSGTKGRGRTKDWTVRDKYRLYFIMKKERTITHKQMLERFNCGNAKPISMSTLRRRVKELKNWVNRVPKKNNCVRNPNRLLRIRWCKLHRSLTIHDWRNWIFTDESMVVIGGQQKIKIWRHRDEKYGPQHCIKNLKKKTYLMVWGAVTYWGARVLIPVRGIVNGQKYARMLSENLPMLLKQLPDDVVPVFQDDNAPCHRTQEVMMTIQNLNVYHTDWPAQSPDANIIECIWRAIKVAIHKTGIIPNNREELWELIFDAWNNLEVSYIQSLYESLPRRMNEIIKMRGFMSKY